MAFDLQKELAAVAKRTGENTSNGNTQVVNTYEGNQEGAVALLAALIGDHGWSIHTAAMEGQGKLAGTDIMIVPAAGKAPRGSASGIITFYHTGRLVVAGNCPVDPTAHGFVA
jgi:hypothetical protein